MGLTSGEKENFFIRFLLSRKIRLISALTLALALIVFPAKTQARVPENVPPPIKIAEKGSPSFLSRVLSHIVIAAGGSSSWGMYEGSNKIFDNPPSSLYTGTRAEREFNKLQPWEMHYQSFWAAFGFRLSFLSLLGKYEVWKLPVINPRFNLENSSYGVIISLPTTDLQAKGVFLRLELHPVAGKLFSPYLAVEAPLSFSLKTLTYNSSSEPEVVQHNFHAFGLDIDDYQNKTLQAKISPVFELGLGIRIKARLRARLYARAYKWQWDLFYFRQLHTPLQIGAGIGIY